MRKIALLTVGLALMSVATASAQTKIASKPGYIGVRYDHEVFFPAPTGEKTPVIVKDVSKGSPAEKAGLKTGDEILRINGMSPANGKFAAVARTLTEGDTVTLRIKRDGKEREYTVVAAARPNYASLAGDRTVYFSSDSVRRIMRLYLDSARVQLEGLKLPRVWVEGDSNNFNIRIQKFGGFPGDTLVFGKDSVLLRHMRDGMPAGDVLMRHFEGEFGPGHVFRSVELGSRSIAGAEFTDFDAAAMKSIFGVDHGLLTVRVAPETPAARAGLMAGDVVVKANNRAVSRVADLRNLLFAEPETLKLEVLRKGQTKILEIQKLRKGNED